MNLELILLYAFLTMPGSIKVTIIAIMALAFIAGAWLLGNYYHSLVFSPLKPDSAKMVSFKIDPGEKAGSVGKRLTQQNLIHSSLFFRIYLRLNQFSGRTIQAGKYQLSPAMSIAQIVKKLQHGTFDEKITIPEGLRFEEIDELLTAKLPSQWAKGRLAQFTALDFSQDFLQDVPYENSLEGFLFPDTYFVPQTITAEELITLMLDNFNQRFTNQMRIDLKEQNLNISEAVTIASIVERETKNENDRPLVAGILIKRLQNNWPLEADATTQYAKATINCQLLTINCEWWPQEITEEDLEIDSPYNTRKVVGIPPGPIANPGLASLKAIVYPEINENWYYVSDSEGNIYYSQTLEEHNAKVALHVR